MSITVFRAASWGDIAAERLSVAWLGRVWESDVHSLLLVDRDGLVVRMVNTGLGNGPFDVVVPDAMAESWAALPRGLYAWRVGKELWLGDHLTLRLPSAEPWPSTLFWQRERLPTDERTLARHLALLADWLLARAPDATIAGLLPELLVAGGPLAKEVADRPHLPMRERLFRWRAARALGSLLPALASGDLATAETSVNHLAGLGTGTPPLGDWFVLGLVAGIQLWPEFLSEGSGLRADSLLQRLVRSVAERTSLLGRALLVAALDEHRWGATWHALHAALLADGPHAGDPRERIEREAAAWLAQDEAVASAALSGLLLPFLWHQRFFL